MKLMKKIMVIALTFLMIITATACSGLKVVKEIATVDGNIISKAEFMYYLENVKSQMLTKAGVTAGTAEAESFWEGEIDGQKASDVAKDKAMEECVRTEICTILAKEAGLTINAETKSSIKSYIEEGGDQIAQIKDMTGLSDSLLKTLFEKSEYANMYAQSYFAEHEEELTAPDEEIQKKYQEEYSRVKHVLITNTPDAEGEETPLADEDFVATQKALAEEVLEKAKSGADFDALVKDYGKDPGMETSPDGYTITKNGQMVAEFEAAAFDIEIGEVSDIVETSYGWHILKRYPLLTEGTEYENNIGTVSSQLSSELFNDYVDTLKGNYTINVKEGTVNSIKVK